MTSVLRRYLLEDTSFARRRAPYHVPRFLQNDFARYWRTMAVDFAYKARTRGGPGAATRNFKLRMSRKLIYVAGLLTCFSCQMGIAHAGGPNACSGPDAECVDCLRSFMRRPPLEIVAQVLRSLATGSEAAARKIMGSYDRFIGILADDARRKELDQLGPDGLDSAAFQEPRQIARDFQDGVTELFFDTRLSDLTRTYGVF